MDGVPDYHTADPAIREIMDGIMAEIDPYDVTTIFNVGRDALNRLGDVADQVMRRSGTESAMLTSLDELQGEIAEINISDLANQAMGVGAKGVKWVAKNPGTAIATVAAGTFLTPFAFLGLPMAKAGLDKVNSMRQGEDVAATLRTTIAKSGNVMEKLEQAGVEIPNEIRSIDELGRSRAEAYRDVSICIGALVERQRILNDEEIPALTAESMADDADYEIEFRVQTLQMSSERMAEKINAMLASRLVSQASMVTLMRLKGIFAQAGGKIQTHLDVSVPQWKAQIAESGVMLAANKITQVIGEADEFGNKVLVQGAAVADKTAEMMAKSVRTGTYDPQKLIGVLENLTRSLTEDVRQIGTRRADLEADRLRLSAAAATFKEKVSGITAQAQGRMALPSPGSRHLALNGPK
jgi:hypothetical protein